MARLFVRKLFITVLAMAASLMLVGGAYALTGTSAPDDAAATVESTTEPTETPEAPEATETEGDEEADGGVHGGTKPRIHEGCEGVEGLEGNWTHGDYVSAVGAQSGAEAKKAAAKSDCGKPDKAAREEQRAEKKAEKQNGRDSGGEDESDDQNEDESDDQNEGESDDQNEDESGS